MSDTLEAFAVENHERMKLAIAVVYLVTAAGGVANGVYLTSALLAVIAVWLLGGVPALKRLVRRPRMQLRHWWDVARNARHLAIHPGVDGTARVVVMRPTLHDGWHWESTEGFPVGNPGDVEAFADGGGDQ